MKMSEQSYENVGSSETDENKQITTEEADGDEVLVNNYGAQDHEGEFEFENPAAFSHQRESPTPSKEPFWEDDGSDGAWVRTVILDLLLWRHPVHSALWLVIFFLVFFLVKVSEYSLLTLACYLILLQLIATTAAIRGAPVLKSMNLLRASFDPKTFALQRQAFSAEELFRFSRGCAEIASSWSLQWNDTLVTRNAKKVVRVASGLFWMAILGLFIPLEIMILLVVITAFSVLKLYELQQDRINEVYEVVKERYDEKVGPMLEKVYPVLDSLLYRLEPVLGRFDD